MASTYTHLDMDVLRSFATGAALGNFAQAADRLGRSSSAVSAQLKKLESQTGMTLLRKAGRGLELTEAGHTMLAYAHRLLALNDEAVVAVRASQLQGLVRLGLPEDLGEHLLPEVLGLFARAHPQVQVQVQSGNSASLQAWYDSGQLELVIHWDMGLAAGWEGPAVQQLAELPLHWIGPAAPQDGGPLPAGSIGPATPLPLVLLSEPCPLRPLVTGLLDRHGLPWRHAFSSPSLSALWGAVSAGLGLAVRTRLGLPAQLRALPAEQVQGLPVLPSMRLLLQCRSGQAPAAQLAALLAQAVQAQLQPLPKI